MKTQNTPENKVRFFAQYWWQNVAVIDSFEWDKTDLVVTEVSNTIYNHLHLPVIDCIKHLELTPLSQITDEDAVEAVMTSLGKPIQDFDGEISEVKRFYADTLFFDLREADFLRSKGYALPWMDLSVEDLIEYGWIKLKE